MELTVDCLNLPKIPYSAGCEIYNDQCLTSMKYLVMALLFIWVESLFNRVNWRHFVATLSGSSL